MAPFCFSRQNSYEQFLPPTRNCTTIPGPRYFWPQICLPHRYLAPDISIPPNNQTLPIPLTHNQPRQAIQFISLLISLGIVAGIGTGTAGLTTSLNYYQSLSKDLNDSLEETANSLITIQNQLDSLAAIVLQNRRGLSLLTKGNSKKSDKQGLENTPTPQ